MSKAWKKIWDFWGPLNLDNISPLIHEGFIQDIQASETQYGRINIPLNMPDGNTSNGLCENSKFEKDEELPNNPHLHLRYP